MRHGAVTNVNRIEPVPKATWAECSRSGVARAGGSGGAGSGAQSVLAEQLHGARLRSPVACSSAKLTREPAASRENPPSSTLLR